ncbi:C40 family peptidase [Lysinibacillus telephonicus]|uniref:C40 family peptidase n=1 Tax=Lysinibacillus telephonicus TaxID=1714840 RepID=UPI00397AA3D2
MKYSKRIKQIFLASAAGLTIYFSPIVSGDASAAEVKEDFTSTELRETAKQYLGTPYKSAGTTASGFDCSGFVLKVFKDLGVSSLPRTSASMYTVGESVSQNELIPGDLVFFNTSGRGVSHVGIYYGDGKFIHASTSQGVTITPLNDKWYWADKYVGAKRISDVKLVSKK